VKCERKGKLFAAELRRITSTRPVVRRVRRPATLRLLMMDNIEEHIDSEELRVLKLAEMQVRDVLRSVWGGGVSTGDRDDVRRARDEIEDLEAARLRLSDAFMKGDRKAREEDRRLERRLRDLSRLIMRAERGAEEESRAEMERRGEQLKEAWRQHHPLEDPDKGRPKRGGV
jgi:hypothetical protein